MKLHRGILILHPALRLPAETLQALRDAGYIPIVGRPEQVQSRPPLSVPMDGGMLTHAALRAVASNDYTRRTFADFIVQSLLLDIGYTIIDGKVVKR